MAKEMSYKSFLTEKPQYGGSSVNRLKKWKDDGEIVIWLHTESSMYKRLIHVIPYVYDKKNEKTGKEVSTIGYFYYVCPEDPDEYRNRRYSDYPKVCPLCRFIDWVANNDDIDPKTMVWETSVGDSKNDRLCNKADITGDTDSGGDWMLSMLPQQEFVFAAIDNEDVASGVVAAIEKYSVGESIRKVVLDTIDSDGPEMGDPALNPYAIKLTYNSKAKKSTDYYHALKYNRVSVTEEILDLLKQDALDLSSLINPGDPKKLRKYMEASIVLEGVPIDIFFDAIDMSAEEDPTDFDPEKLEKPKSKPQPKKKVEEEKPKPVQRKPAKKPEPEPEPEDEETEATDDDDTCPMCNGTGIRKGKKCKICNGTGHVDLEGEEEEAPVEKPKPAPKKPSKPKPEPEPEPDDEEALYECDTCGQPLGADDNECPKCGARFD